MTELVKQAEYRQWIVSIKQRVQASQIKAAVAVNREMLELYWFLGEQILEKQQTAKWGDGFLAQMSKDLMAEFPEIKGFSHRNLQIMRKWVRFWSNPSAIGQQLAAQITAIAQQPAAQILLLNAPQLVAQIPWGHNMLLLQKLRNPSGKHSPKVCT